MLAIALVGVCVVAMGYQAFGPHGYQMLQVREKQKAQLEKEVHKLTIENIQLSTEVDKLKNDPKTMEDLARQDLKMAKPGERIYVLPPER